MRHQGRLLLLQGLAHWAPLLLLLLLGCRRCQQGAHTGRRHEQAELHAL
jgi:hypothetical protein